MARSPHGRRKRIGRLKARVTSDADDHFLRCTIPGCGRPTARAAKQGLSASLCRKHLVHRQRHGSAWCATPAATVLRPYVRAARSFISSSRADPYVSHALVGLGTLMASAGLAEIATRLRGLPAERRARIALARLREAGIQPERLLAVTIAVHSLIEEAPQVVHRIREWRIVAIAKGCHRLASVYRPWTFIGADGRVHRAAKQAYPRSSGRVLRYLGEMIERESEWVIEKHLAAVLALKVARYGAHPATINPVKFATTAGHRAHP
ncbi:hypothetical protein ABIA03_002861 [Bradyrhizobium yuanmingense]